MNKNIYNLKKILTIIFIVLSQTVFSQLLDENFSYNPGTFLSTNGWISINNQGINPIKVVQGNLSYNGYGFSGIGNSVKLDSLGGEEDAIIFFPRDDGSVYSVFLVKVISATQGENYFFHFGTTQSGTADRGRVFVKRDVNNNIAFGISKRRSYGVYTGFIYSLNTTYLLVLKYIFSEGNSVNDSVELFINPSINSTEPIPDLITGQGENDETNNINSAVLRQGDGITSPYLIFDGLCVTTSWSNSPLPVMLSSFQAQLYNRNVFLSWRTSQEINNSGFYLERFSASISNSWESIAFIKGFGTTTTPQSYSYTDNNLNSGVFKYRLKQFDYNGNYEFFYLNDNISVGHPISFDVSQNYPNPSNPVSKIDYQIPISSNVNIEVFDITGKVVISLFEGNQEPGYYSVKFDGSNFSSGIYFYRIKISGISQSFSKTMKLILVK